MKKVIFTIIVLLVLLPLGCKEEIKEPVKKTLVSDKEYIYKDLSDCLHYDKDCFHIAISSLETESGNIFFYDSTCLKHLLGHDYSVKRIKLNNLLTTDMELCCRECISDAIYDSLLNYAHNPNEKWIPGFNPEILDKIKKSLPHLFDTVDSLDEIHTWVKTPGTVGILNRKILFNIYRSYGGYDGTYPDFLKSLWITPTAEDIKEYKEIDENLRKRKEYWDQYKRENIPPSRRNL